MNHTLFLKTSLNFSAEHHFSATPIARLFEAFLNGTILEKTLLEEAFSCSDRFVPNSPWEVIDQWRDLLTLVLMLKARDQIPTFRDLIIQKIQHLKRIFLWREFQLGSIFQVLVSFLVDDRQNPEPIHQLPSGACPVEGGEHWAWGEIPQPGFHAELGILWVLFAAMSKNSSFLQAAENLADWQTNILDHEFIPFAGIYSQEGSVSEDALLMYNYLLFDTVANATARTDFAFIAEKLSNLLSEKTLKSSLSIPKYLVVLEIFLNFFYQKTRGSSYSLRRNVKDSFLGLVGCRMEGYSGIGTLSGGGTGMGCFHYKDVQFVNFGPQHLPLADCRGFGLEGGMRLLSQHIKALSSNHECYTLEGIARMNPKSKESSVLPLFREGNDSSFWLNTKQNFSNGKLSLQVSFNGFYKLSSLAFVFFVKSESCFVEGKKVVKPRSFDQYKGEACQVQIKGKRSSVSLSCEDRQVGEMQVIPLGGGSNFWGADFLIAYICLDNKPDYSWQLTGF